MEKTVWQVIADHLIDKGYSVYPPAIHEGECKNPYIVIVDEGGNKYQNFSTQVTYYSILVYVPKNKYTLLAEYIHKVEKDMAELAPMLMPTGLKTPDFYDDSVKGHMQSIQYYSYARNKLL